MISAMPLQDLSPGAEIDIEIFGLEPTSECLAPHMGWADFLAAEIAGNISRKKVVLAQKVFLERRRCTRGKMWLGQKTPRQQTQPSPL